jgi:hypothetical protein
MGAYPWLVALFLVALIFYVLAIIHSNKND